MIDPRHVRATGRTGIASVLAICLAACSGVTLPPFGASSEAPGVPKIHPGDIVGEWGLSSFQRAEDRSHAEVLAKQSASSPM